MSDTVVNPWAMVVHPVYTMLALAAVMYFWNFYTPTLSTFVGWWRGVLRVTSVFLLDTIALIRAITMVHLVL